MANRFIFQKLAGMSRSASRLGAHATSSARAATTTEILSSVFRGAAVPHPSNRGIHGFATRYFNIFPCSLADAKTSWKTTGIPSAIVHRMKPDFLGYARGVQQTFSSSASNNHRFTLEAEKIAQQAKNAARKPEMPVHEVIEKDVNTSIALLAFISVSLIYTLNSTSPIDSSSSNNRCCNCQCHGQNPKVQGDKELQVL